MNSRGFTLVEILVSFAIVAILASLTFVGAKRVMERSKQVKCISHMKSFHGALSSAILDQDGWPQMPLEDGEWSEARYYKWWALELEKYGVAREVWLCPGDDGGKKRMMEARDEDAEFIGSYGISKFESGARTPFRFNQPWIIERGAYHKTGGNVLMPDGSISSRTNPFGGR